MNEQGGRVVAIDLWRITVVCLLVGPNELSPEHSSSSFGRCSLASAWQLESHAACELGVTRLAYCQ